MAAISAQQLLLACVCALLTTLPTVTASRRGDGESGESSSRPRTGTRCQLLSREVLTAEDETATPPLPAVHRLRFSLPATAQTNVRCCGGKEGMLHVSSCVPACFLGPTLYLLCALQSLQPPLPGAVVFLVFSGA